MTSQVRLAIGTVVVLIAGLCVYATRQVDPDLFGYLAYGRLFVQHGGPIETDPFAYTSAGFHWVAFEYLAQGLLWTAYDRFGPVGLIGLKMALGAIAILFLWKAVRATSDDPFVWMPIFLLCTSTISRYFVFRPQLFTFACFAFFVAVLFRFVLGRKTVLWVLPPVMLVWVNAHGGFVAGLGVIVLAAIVRVCANVNPQGAGGQSALKGIRPLILTLAACLAVTFLNPWGGHLWGYVLTELSHGTNRRYVAEWSPAGRHVDPWSGAALTAITITLIGVGWLAHRRGRHVAGLHPWQWVASAVPLIVMAYTSVRHVPLAAIWTAPVICLLGTALNGSEAAQAFRRLWLAVSSVAFVPILLTIEFVVAHPAPVIAMGGTTLGAKDPCHVVSFIQKNGLSGNVYNPLWWGSYLTWEAYPGIRVSMDGRNISLFPDAMVGENLRFYSRDARENDLEAPLRYDTDFLLVPSDAAILRLVRSDYRWQQLYADDDSFLFVRADAAHASMASAINVRAIKPPVEPCPPVLK